MRDDWRRLFRAVLACTGAGGVAGFAYVLLAWFCGDLIGTAAGAMSRGPALLLGSASVGLGFLVAWVAERVAGVSGPILLIPVFVGAVTAAGVAVILCARHLGLEFDRTVGLMAISAFVLCGIAAWQVLLD